MANDYDFDLEFKVGIGDTDYPFKHDNLITAMEGYADEVEAARDGENSVLLNLQNNYINYTLSNDVNGNSNTYKCTNMPVGELGSNDYCTVAQAQSLVSGDVPTDITDLVPGGSFSPNDILVVNNTGDAITGRPTTYTNVPTTSAANGNYDMNLGGGSNDTTLPTGSDGMVISYADLGGNAGKNGGGPPQTPYLRIIPNGTEKIMGVNDDLYIDDYPYCSFDLVYTGTTFGWILARFQR